MTHSHAHMLRANERSAEVRSRRSELKREVKAREVDAAELLAEVELPDWLAGMKVVDLLGAIPYMTKAKATNLCESLWVPSFKPLGRMTYTQRRNVAGKVAEWHERKQAGQAAKSRGRGTG